MNDYRSELEQWVDLWDDAQEKGVHPNGESPEQSQSVGFGSKQTLGFGSKAQDDYYDYLDSQVPGLLQELRIPNPIYPDSAGPDSETTPPVWADEDLLKEVEGLKKKLFDLENKMAALGGEKKVLEKAQVYKAGNDKMMSEIKSLRDKIEKVSSTLGIKHEPSPWDTSHLKRVEDK